MSYSSGWFQAFWLSLFLFVPAWRATAEADSSRPIELRVDATEAPRRRFHAKLPIPAKPGPLTLVYPQWGSREPAPNGPISGLSGLKILAGEKAGPWDRDDVDLYAFHI